MFYIGCHLSVSKGFTNMGRETIEIGGNCFQFFSRNPRGGKSKEWELSDIEKYTELARENSFGKILAHAPYVINPCAKDEDMREYAYSVIREDLEKLEDVPDCQYNFHPGSHVGQGSEAGVEYISGMLNKLEISKFKTNVLLETMAGKGTEMGRSFEELRAIIDRVSDNESLGVCLDTCHVFDGGYDIVNNLDGVLDEFDRVIGLGRLKAIHINDSKNVLGSHKDRHEKIGEGNIGADTFKALINNPRLSGIPCYLETPNELDGYAAEIKLLKSMYNQS